MAKASEMRACNPIIVSTNHLVLRTIQKYEDLSERVQAAFDKYQDRDLDGARAVLIQLSNSFWELENYSRDLIYVLLADPCLESDIPPANADRLSAIAERSSEISDTVFKLSTSIGPQQDI
jgi:hypothetical protein